jgi:hypothetical protein
MWAVTGFGACSVTYFQEELDNEKNHPVADLTAAYRRVVASRPIGIRAR